MEVIVYIDVFWFRAFFTEFFTCMFVNLWMKQSRPVIRVLAFSAAAVSAEVLLFVAAGYGMAYAAGALLLHLLLLYGLFRPGSRGVFVRLFLWSMAAETAAGGIFSLCRRKLFGDYWFGAGLCILALSVMGSLILEERRREQDVRLFRIMLLHNGRSVEVTGLHDTGNRLMDPYTHAPVHIVAESVAQALLLTQEPCRLIPYSSVGETDGLMRVWTIDAMEWPGKKTCGAVIGAADDVLFAHREYKLILAAGFDPT